MKALHRDGRAVEVGAIHSTAAARANAKAAKEAAKKAQEYATTKGDASSRLTKALPYNHDKGMAMVVEVLLDAPFANEDEEATAAHGDRRPRDPKDRSRLLQLDEEIAQRLKLSARQVRRYLAVLKADRLAEQYAVDKRGLGDTEKWLKEQVAYTVTLWNDNPISVTPPNFIELAVTETDPGVKGDTAQGGSKPATLSSGAVVRVPLFINEGEVLKVDTRSGEYVSRA